MHLKKSNPTLIFPFYQHGVDLNQHHWPSSSETNEALNTNDHGIETDDDDTDGNGMAWTADGSGVWSPVIAVVGGSGSAIDGGYVTGSSVVGGYVDLYQNSDGTVTVVMTTTNSDGSTTTTEATYSSLESYNNGDSAISVTDSTTGGPEDTGTTDSGNDSDNSEPGWNDEYHEDEYEPKGGRDVEEQGEETVVVEWNTSANTIDDVNSGNIVQQEEEVIVPGQSNPDDDDDKADETVTVSYHEVKDDIAYANIIDAYVFNKETWVVTVEKNIEEVAPRDKPIIYNGPLITINNKYLLLPTNSIIPGGIFIDTSRYFVNVIEYEDNVTVAVSWFSDEESWTLRAGSFKVEVTPGEIIEDIENTVWGIKNEWDKWQFEKNY